MSDIEDELHAILGPMVDLPPMNDAEEAVRFIAELKARR